MASVTPDSAERTQQVISPFAETKSTLPTAPRRGGLFRPLWLASGLIVLAMISAGSYFAFAYLHDPVRTLTPFPVDKYFDDFQPSSRAANSDADYCILPIGLRNPTLANSWSLPPPTTPSLFPC